MVGRDSGQMRWFRSGSMAVMLPLALSVLAPSCGFKALAAETVAAGGGDEGAVRIGRRIYDRLRPFFQISGMLSLKITCSRGWCSS